MEKPWTNSETETAKRLWNEGFSAAEVAAALNTGRSRNSVIGKLHRLGVPKRDTNVRRVVKRVLPRKIAAPRPQAPRAPRDIALGTWKRSPLPRPAVHVDPTDPAAIMARTLLASAYAAERRRNAMREAPRL